jgi:hypothetical protein
MGFLGQSSHFEVTVLIKLVTMLDQVPMDKVPSTEYCTVLNESEDVFKEILGLPPKKDINLSINIMSGVTHISKIPYRMSTLELKEL